MIATQQKNLSTVGFDRSVVLRGILLAVSCAISFWLITHILPTLYSASRGDELLGGMWAVAATISFIDIATRRTFALRCLV